MKKKFVVLLSFILMLSLSACSSKENSTNKKEEIAFPEVDGNIEEGKIDDISFKESSKITNYIKIEMADSSIILLELYPDKAPITVKNFQKLVQEHFYDNLTFHRVVKNFMVQGGDPTGTGGGGSDETIKGEFKSNGVNNTISHTRGTISMARSNNPDSASSQFFICDANSTHLDGNYAAFGHMLAGYETLDRIASVKTKKELAINPPKIKTIRFVTIEN